MCPSDWYLVSVMYGRMKMVDPWFFVHVLEERDGRKVKNWWHVVSFWCCVDAPAG